MNPSLVTRAQRVLAGGVSSNARLATNDMVLSHGDGPHVWDVAGNRYVDYLLGRGPAFLGHNPPEVVTAVQSVMIRGMGLGATTQLEIEAAEALVDLLEWPDMVRFTTTGTEADQLALRLARAATGRPMTVQFQDHYHGWMDSTSVTGGDDFRARPRTRGQSAAAIADTIVVAFNDLPSLVEAFDRHEGTIAAVILEPVMMNGHGALPAPGFLEAVRDLTTARGAVLIFDEIVTGFRLGPRGAVGWSGVVPDLAVYAKAAASGWPVAVVAGRRELLEPLGTGTVNHAGTYSGSMASMAALTATLGILAGGAPYERVERHGTALMRGIREAAADTGVGVHVRGFPGAFFSNVLCTAADPQPHSGYTPDTGRIIQLARHLRRNGVWVGDRGSWYVSAAHDDADVQRTLEAVRTGLERLSHRTAADRDERESIR